MSVIFKFLLAALWLCCDSAHAIDYPPPHPAFGGLGRPSFPYGGGGGGGGGVVDPATSGGCFNYYIGEQQRVSTAYSADYNGCLLTAKLERDRVHNDVAQSRHALVNATAALCARIRACNSLNDTLKVFQCHSQSGGVNIRTAYDASDNSTQIGSMMVERFRMIDVGQEQCTHNVRRTYISDVGKNYNTLQNCLTPPYMMLPPLLGGGGRPGRYPRPPALPSMSTPTTEQPLVSSTARTTTTPSSTTTSSPPPPTKEQPLESSTPSSSSTSPPITSTTESFVPPSSNTSPPP